VSRYVHYLGDPDVDPGRRDLLGGKGAGLAEMRRLGVPVPPAFAISTEACNAYFAEGGLPAGLMGEVRAAVARIGAETGRGLGDAARPLLVSVRSGARVSMPGMMDTVLNLGLNDATAAGLSADRRFALDCHRRFLSMYGDVVLGMKPASDRDPDPFQALLEARLAARHLQRDTELSADDLALLVGDYRQAIARATGAPAPEDPWAQLEGAIAAVFRSWNGDRAIAYRRMYGYPDSWGTAVVVQAMVFGNLSDDSATGVVFTRDPVSGERRLYGEFLEKAQGEDVVAGIRTPRQIAELESVLPVAYAELVAACERLETHFRDLQDIEFTIEQKRLFILQTRSGKRAARAMVKVAVDLVREGKLTQHQAIQRIEAGKLDELLHPNVDPAADKVLLTKGLPASPGAAIGRIVFTAAEAEAMVVRGEPCLLVRVETSPEDIHGMKAAAGILTSRGGMTSHAAVVARGMGKCCIVSAQGIVVDPRAGTLIAGGRTFRTGDVLTLDGTRGEVLLGAVPLVPATVSPELGELMGWVDAVRRLRVRTNADTAVDARTARAFGAEGIGLCRTEHMFFSPDRILAVRRMILATTAADRRAALDEIVPMQQGDFLALFRVMDGLPVTIRLLDPPLHEFLPHNDTEVKALAAELRVEERVLRNRLADLAEANPMLGHRGCRLAVTYPEIYQAQVRAIAAATAAATAAGVAVHPEIMIPIVGLKGEIERMHALVLEAWGPSPPPPIGTMIELPRACLVAGSLAEHAEFFSFGTNDLTQTTFGFSRDDIGHFLPEYLQKGILARDPFAGLDQEGVGALMALAVERGRKARPGLKIGICGEHGGDPASVHFCHRIGLDYVSCSPFRVPVARVAAAQAALEEGNAS
jgi:pyruvate, orthophosphate dikinase